jgi:hypothetical protein
MTLLKPTPVSAPGSTATNPDAQALFVPYPANVLFAAVSAAMTGGNIHVTRTDEHGTATQTFRPDSPLFNLTNPACGGNLVCPLDPQTTGATVVVLTFTNTTEKDTHHATVVVALGYRSTVNQVVGAIESPVAAGRSVAVTLVFQRLPVDEPTALA